MSATGTKTPPAKATLIQQVKAHTTGGTEGGTLPKIDNKKFAVVHKDYVLDYTKPLKNVIMEMESGDGGLTYRYVHGLRKVETVIYGMSNGAGSVMQYIYDDENGEKAISTKDPGKNVAKESVVKLYFHQDHLGTTDYITDNVAGKNASYVSYDDWGALTAKAVLKMGVRELDLVQDYTGHPYDQVLGIFYAKARMYDAEDRRFMAVDPVKGDLINPQTLVAYTYVINNPMKYVDPDGREWTSTDAYVYDLLLNNMGTLQALTFHSEVQSATQDYKRAQQDNNWFFMNQARYWAVEARQQYYPMFVCEYIDTYDYAYGQKEFIYLGVHAVFHTPFYHTSILIFVTPDSSFYYDEDFKNKNLYSEKLRYATIGAESGMVEGQLNYKVNRPSDSNLSIKVEMIKIEVANTEAVINNLFTLAKGFTNRTFPYWFFPSDDSAPLTPTDREEYIPDNPQGNTYNSNSFTKGLLDAAGITVQKPKNNVAGWEKPVPKGSFGI